MPRPTPSTRKWRVARARLGGIARARKMSARARRLCARKAAVARWAKRGKA